MNDYYLISIFIPLNTISILFYHQYLYYIITSMFLTHHLPLLIHISMILIQPYYHITISIIT